MLYVWAKKLSGHTFSSLQVKKPIFLSSSYVRLWPLKQNVKKCSQFLFTSITFAISVIVLALSISLRWSIFTFRSLKTGKNSVIWKKREKVKPGANFMSSKGACVPLKLSGAQLSKQGVIFRYSFAKFSPGVTLLSTFN